MGSSAGFAPGYGIDRASLNCPRERPLSCERGALRRRPDLVARLAPGGPRLFGLRLGKHHVLGAPVVTTGRAGDARTWFRLLPLFRTSRDFAGLALRSVDRRRSVNRQAQLPARRRKSRRRGGVSGVAAKSVGGAVALRQQWPRWQGRREQSREIRFESSGREWGSRPFKSWLFGLGRCAWVGRRNIGAQETDTRRRCDLRGESVRGYCQVRRWDICYR